MHLSKVIEPAPIAPNLLVKKVPAKCLPERKRGQFYSVHELEDGYGCKERSEGDAIATLTNLQSDVVAREATFKTIVKTANGETR